MTNISEVQDFDLKKLRRYFGYNQSMLSEATKITRATLSRYEQGKIDASVENIEKLTKVFQKHVEGFTYQDMYKILENSKQELVLS